MSIWTVIGRETAQPVVPPGVYLDQQIGSQSTDQQIDYILPFIARDDPEKQAYKDGNREGESLSLIHI